MGGGSEDVVDVAPSVQRSGGSGKDFADSVPHLSQAGFAAVRGPSLVMFYAPWCSHCTEMKSAYVEAGQKIGDRALVAAVDCTLQPSVCQAQDIKGYPTVRLFKSSTEAGDDYMGDRSAADMIKFVQERLLGRATAPQGWEYSGATQHLDEAGLHQLQANPKQTAMIMFYGLHHYAL